MSYPEINKISTILDSIHDLTGLSVFWKNPHRIIQSGIPLRQSVHCCEFCVTVKKDAEKLSRCNKNDDILIEQKAKSLGHSFLNTCHAGGTELVVPIFNKDHYRSL